MTKDDIIKLFVENSESNGIFHSCLGSCLSDVLDYFSADDIKGTIKLGRSYIWQYASNSDDVFNKRMPDVILICRNEQMKDCIFLYEIED